MTYIWHLITSEFPPDVCGVGDQSLLLARELATHGDEVHVYTRKTEAQPPSIERVHVNQVFRDYGRSDLRQLGELLDRHPAPRRVLVQWVPHGYGFRSLNLHIARWLFRRGAAGDMIEVIVHEPGLGWRGGGTTHAIAALVHRVMLWLAFRNARRGWVTIPAWKSRVRPYARKGLEIGWLPATSPVPVTNDPKRVRELRGKFAPRSMLIGIFGRRPTADRHFQRSIVEVLSRRNDVNVVVIGSGSREAAIDLLALDPRFEGRIHATGTLAPEEVSLVIQACDVMLQLYPDGVSARRTSLISSLAHGVPIVTNEGAHSEDIWRESGGVALAPDGDVEAVVRRVDDFLGDEAKRRSFGDRALALFEAEFQLSHAVQRLRSGTKR